MKIRKLSKGDIAAASKIVGKNYSVGYKKSSAKEMGAMFSESIMPPRYFVAVDHKKIIGCGGYSQSWMDYNVYQIFWINVDPEYQMMGVGTKIVRKILYDIKIAHGKDKKAYLILLTTNKPRFYSKKFGFKTLERFKRNGHYLMSLELR